MAGLRAQLTAGVAVGVVATITMDAAMLAAGRLGGEAFASDRLDVAVIGRWGAGLLQGRVHHADASREHAEPSDAAFGIATHYLTGIALAEAFLLLPSPRLRSSFPAAVIYGLATAVLPLFVLFPSLGYGYLGRRSGEAARMARIMLIGHTAFGAGIGLGVRRLVRR